MTDPMRFIVERLGTADLPQVRGMLRLLGEAFDELDTYSGDEPDDAYLISALGDENLVVLAAFVGDEVVGGLIVYELRKLERARSEFYIYDLAVHERYRRHGVATGLIEALKPIARSRGGSVIFVQADVVDAPAVALYESLGLREDGVYHFDIEVD